MEGQDNPVAGCIIFLIFIVFNSIFYGFGSAIQHINENDVELKAQEGDKKSSQLLKMLSKPADLINTIQVIATLLSILIGFSLIRSFSGYFNRLLAGYPFGGTDGNVSFVSDCADSGNPGKHDFTAFAGDSGS